MKFQKSNEAGDCSSPVPPTAGAVLTEEGKAHRTLYACCMDTRSGVYHYRREGDGSVHSVPLGRPAWDGDVLVRV